MKDNFPLLWAMCGTYAPGLEKLFEAKKYNVKIIKCKRIKLQEVKNE